MPLGYLFALPLHGGATGMWWGLAMGLLSASVALVWIWVRACNAPATWTTTGTNPSNTAPLFTPSNTSGAPLPDSRARISTDFATVPAASLS